MKIKNIFKRCIIFILIILVSVIVFFAWVSKSNSIVYEEKYTLLKNESKDSKNAIVIYQPSRTSFSEDVASQIAEGVHSCGYNVYLSTVCKNLDKDLSQYDLVIFGSPIYMSNYSSVIGEYIKSVSDFGQAKIIFYTTGMLNNTVEFDNIKKIFDKEVYLTKITKDKCIEDEKYAYKIGESLANR